MAIHRFETTSEAYDACQCDDNIKDGDTLIIEPEGVVGIADTWPVAVTEDCGDLHRKLPTFTWDGFARYNNTPRYKITMAMIEAECLGLAIDP